MYFEIERKSIFVLGVLLLYMFTSVHSLMVGQEMDDFESRLTEFTLENGLKFIIFEPLLAQSNKTSRILLI